MANWVIEKVEQSPVDLVKGNHPTAKYSVALQRQGSGFTAYATVNFAKLQLVLAHFGVKLPADLKGKSFESDKGDTKSALQSFVDRLVGEQESSS